MRDPDWPALRAQVEQAAPEAQIVKMKFFMGMKADEIAEALGV